MADRKVREVMTQAVVTVTPTTSLHEAAQILAGQHISGAPVVRGDKVVGIISESDLLMAALPPAHVDGGPTALDVLATFVTGRPHPPPELMLVEGFMSSYVVSIAPDDSIWRAATMMEQHGVKRLPVTERDGTLVGIVSRADVVRAMARTDSELADDVTEAIRVLGEETIPDLRVRASEGIVTLLGEADRRSTKELAMRLAIRTPGVLEVIDRLGYRHDERQGGYRPLNDPKDPRLDWHGDPLLEGRPS